MEMKTKKVETFSTHIHNTGFSRMKCQFQDSHDLPDFLQGSFGVSQGTTDDDEVIGIPD